MQITMGKCVAAALSHLLTQKICALVPIRSAVFANDGNTTAEEPVRIIYREPAKSIPGCVQILSSIKARNMNE